MQSTRRLVYTPDPNKFDLRTHHWDGQGALVQKNLYTCYVREGQQYFERPVNSGNLWHGNNQPAGRVTKQFNDAGHEISKSFDHTAPHVKFTPKLTGDDALHYQLEQERARSAALEAEVAAIRKERTPAAVSTAGLEVMAARPAPPRLGKS